MGDRNNPIKFGPEWLRNLSSEPTNSATGRESTVPGNQRPPSPGAAGLPPSHRPSNTQNSSKVLLAKQRYGREEMLALYDRQTVEAPVQLKANDVLYQQRGKLPFALNTTFEDDSRNSLRGSSSISSMSSSERYQNTNRGRGHISLGVTEIKGRSSSAVESRGRNKVYNRQTSVLRATTNWHGNQRNTYSGMPDDVPNQSLRMWNNNSSQSSGLRPTNLEQPDWQNKQQQQYRIKRQTSTNWRQQQNRDDGEEWRSGDPGRRPQEKWEWEWQESRGRPYPENKSWHTNRRTWVGGDSNEDPLPEWAMDNAEGYGGTFDSSGAFHGYSNDDSNLPKNQEPSYALARSQTHGSFVRSKTSEEGSEEWWASEKAKKLSPKRFDASELKIKRPQATSQPGNAEDKSNLFPASGASDANGKSTGAIPKKNYQEPGNGRMSRNHKSRSADKDNDGLENNAAKSDALDRGESNQKQIENTSKEKPYDARSENNENPNEEKGNFKSVILTQNNSLREKHQNIVVTPTETPKRQPNQNIMHQLFANSNQPRQTDIDDEKQKEQENNKLVEDLLQMNLDHAIPSATMSQMLTNHSNSGVNSLAQLPNPPMQMRMASPLDGLGMGSQNNHNMPQPSTEMQPSRLHSSMMQPIGITNSMLNASLGLPMPISSSGMSLQGINQSVHNSGLANQNMLAAPLQGMGGGNMQSSSLQSGPTNLQGIPLPSMQVSGMQVGSLQSNMQAGVMTNNGLQSGGIGLPGFPNTNNGIPGMNNNNSLFNNMPNANDMSNHGGQNMFPMHGLQQSASQNFNNSIFGNMMNPALPPLPNMGMHQAMDQWYYEDPNKIIQGPFTSKDMYNWFHAGFFSPSLMVRRACDTTMRPLGTYGHMPFGPMDALPPYPMGGGFDLHSQQSHDNMMNSQPNLGVNVKSLWGQPANNNPAPADLMWMQVMNNNPRNDNRVNNLPMYFWDNQSSTMPTPPLLPEDIKTEDEILAQMRAAQPVKSSSPLSFLEPIISPDSSFNAANPPLDMEQLQKLIEDEDIPLPSEDAEKPRQETTQKAEAKKDASKSQNKIDVKASKDATKLDNNGKPVKVKDAPTKTKKNKEGKKEEKREESVEKKYEEVKAKARSAETSPSKNKKEDKLNKKEIEKEKKEWIKEGFTIVKNAEKSKDSKKKAEENKAAEEAERKKKEEEKLLAEEKKRQLEATKKQQETQNQQQIPLPPQRQVAESVNKKAPWSASSQVLQSTSRDGPTLAEIQRLEREKKLEQMKEQQQMMQIIAQQQAAALAREQEMQAGLGWAKKIPPATTQNQTLAEIQAEARKQAAATAAASAAAAVAVAEAVAARVAAVVTPPLVNTVPWGSALNGPANQYTAGFWDTMPVEASKTAPQQAEVSKPAEPKAKKKVTVTPPPKKNNSPSAEFDAWCNTMLSSWRDISIDIPTFVCFLKDIESPYEVKDYVKCYLGDTREAGDFARQFLERRSRLLRVGMVTPSDDLCSPAAAINPRTNSGSDYTEVKGKGKKTKKNKMLKVDARNILGFSVTASEDRINIGDIDSV